MLYENKLTNLVFKNQENSAKHNLVPFSPFFLFKKKKTKTIKNEMHECYAMQILETEKTKKKKTMVTKNNNEAKGPCQKDSIRLSLCIQNFLDAPRALEFLFTWE